MAEGLPGPLVIGGSGGSGSRLVAAIVAAGGRYLGADLNSSLDAEDLADFDWIWGLRLLSGEAGEAAAPAFAAAVERHRARMPGDAQGWGWKHPHSYLLIPFLASHFPDLRFIHVVRDGRDMALSANQRQLGRYGELALGAGDDADAGRRLRFWAWANGRAADDGARLLGDRYLQVRLEDVCTDSATWTRRILAFSGTPEVVVPDGVVSTPRDLGRGAGLAVPAEAAAALARFGYPEAPVAAGKAPGWIATEVRARLAPAPERAVWPTVSAVVPTHDGLPLVERLFGGLAETDYPALEVVLVDNASTDGTLEWACSAPVPFPVVVVRNHRNVSFSAACNLGSARASGELLLFLNNDVEPLEPDWLRRLVACREEHVAAIAGAVLVDPDRSSTRGRIGAVQHQGLEFAPRDGVVRPRLIGLGDDLADAMGPDRDVPAVAAACALMARDDFLGVGGFHEGFRYGAEDADLCLRLRARGRHIVLSGSAVLLHRPLSTRRTVPEGRGEGVFANHRLLLERWGPALRREYGDGEVRYTVRPGGGDSGMRLAAAIAATGRRATVQDASDAWLTDDIVVHVGEGRWPLVSGRVNLRVGDPPDGRTGFDAVVAEDAGADAIVAAAERALEHAGGPRRIRPSRAPSRGRQAVVVLGMARTGSSATTRILNLLGVELGPHDHLMAAIAGVNDKGFYEHHPLVRVNMALLRRLGGSWRDLPDLPSGWEHDAGLDDLREEVREILAADFAGAACWGFKDPRTSLTLPFWRPLLGPVRFVICHRHPLEIAASLQRRDGLDISQSIALWRRYTTASIAQTAGEPRIVVGYDQLFADRSGVVSRLAAFVGRPERAADPLVRGEVERWVEHGLRHHTTHADEAFGHPALTDADRLLVLALDLAARGGDAPLDAAAAQAAQRPVTAEPLS